MEAKSFKQKRAILFARSGGHRGHIPSALDQQITQCRAFAEQQGMLVIDEVRSYGAFRPEMGTPNPLVVRKQIKGDFDLLVIANLSRL